MLTRAIHPHAPRASESVSPWYNLQHDAASLRLRSAAGRFLVHSSQEGAPPSVPTTHGRLACRVSYGQCVVHEPACRTPFLARSASCAALCAALCVREPGAAAVRSASRCRSLALSAHAERAVGCGEPRARGVPPSRYRLCAYAPMRECRQLELTAVHGTFSPSAEGAPIHARPRPRAPTPTPARASTRA